jgi:hypothetical protein
MSMLITEQIHMNRRKKGVQILKAQAKKHNAKSSTKIKPKYISKAQRAKLEISAIDENASVVV